MATKERLHPRRTAIRYQMEDDIPTLALMDCGKLKPIGESALGKVIRGQVKFSCERAGRLAGYSIISFPEIGEFKNAIVLERIVVDVNFRRQGVGRAMLDHALDRLNTRHTLVVDVDERYEEAIAFFGGVEIHAERSARIIKGAMFDLVRFSLTRF